jgi:hypothetical protein
MRADDQVAGLAATECEPEPYVLCFSCSFASGESVIVPDADAVSHGLAHAAARIEFARLPTSR